MEDHHHPSRLGRAFAVGSLALLGAATAFAFARVFTAGAAPRLLAAAWLGLAIGVALERRGSLVATLAAAATLALAVAWFVFPETLWFGLPTAATARAVGTAFGQVGMQAQRQISPTAPIPPLVLAAVTAVFASSFSAHTLAVRAASPALALVPSVALIAFADAALRGNGSMPAAVLFLIGAITLFLSDGLRRIGRWGPVRPSGSHRTAAVLARGAGGVATLTVAIAIVAPGLLPGYGGDALLDVRNSGGDTNLDPLVSIGESLNRDRMIRLFRVDATEPTYWRLLGLETFEDDTWSTDDLQAVNGDDLLSGASLPVEIDAAVEADQAVTVLADLGFTWIPVAFPTTRVDLGGASFRVDRELGTLVAPEPLEAGSTYTTTSLVPAPSPKELNAAGPPASPQLLPRYVALPGDVPEVVGRLARSWTATAETDYQRAFAIQQRLRSPLSGFRYDVGYVVPDGVDPLIDFLTGSKRGFCQQFAGTMAVMLRELGVPARVAVGFTTGRPIAVGRYEVSTENAHAWVEVYFEGYGWLPFEPTPGRTNFAARSYLQPVAAPCTGPGCATGPQGRGRGARGGSGAETDLGRVRAERSAPAPAALPTQDGAGSWRRFVAPVLAIAAGLAALVLLLVPPVKALRRRRRLRRAPDPRALVLATFDVFAARAGDLGLERHSPETLEEFAARLRRATAPDGPRAADGNDVPGDLETLTELTQRAAYGAAAIAPDDARSARGSARTILRSLRQRRGRLRTVRYVWRRGL